MRYLIIIFFTLVGFLGSLSLPTLISAEESAKIYLNVNFDEVAPGSLVEVKVLSSSVEEINAFDIVLEYSTELFYFERAYTQDSVASLWKALPSVSGGGTISLVGGSISPWRGGDREIATLIFKARREGVSSFSFRKSGLALADGKGTLIEAQKTGHKVAVLRGAHFSGSGAELLSDPPKVAGASLISDPITKNPVIVLDIPDAGSIKWLGVRSRSWLFWSNWQKAQLNASIPKYAWVAQIRALGFDGEEVTSTLYRWNIAFIKFVFLVFIILLLLIIWRKFKPKANDF